MKNFFTTILALIWKTLSSNVTNTWEPTEYIWNFHLIENCNVNTCQSPFDYFQNGYFFDTDVYRHIKKGDVIWLKCCYVERFINEVLPETTAPFIMLIADGDASFPSDCNTNIEEWIHHENILAVFAQNCDYRGKSSKIFPIPIGVDFHTNAYKEHPTDTRASPIEQELQLIEILDTLKPTHLRKKRAFVDFQLSDTLRGCHQRYLTLGEDRTMIFQQIVQSGLIDHSTWMKRSALWQTKGQYAFSVSPHGNGLDTHRTWEDLILGCIVIVKTSPLDPLYDGLPVVIVQNWDEIHEENLDKWLEEFGDAFHNPNFRQKLTNKYWLNQIQLKK